MNHLPLDFDTMVIGGGPAGLTAAMFAKNKNISVAVIDDHSGGGQLSVLYPNKPIYNYPGYLGIKAGELSDHLLEQFRQHQIPFITNTAVGQISLVAEQPPTFKISTAASSYLCKSVILACGMGQFLPRKLSIPGEDELAGTQLFYTVDNPEQWRGKEVVVIGGGNSAFDNALFLEQNDCQVTLVHTLEKFQADPATVEKAQNKLADIKTGTAVRQLKKEDKKVHILTHSGHDSIKEELSAERVLINIGLRPDLSFLQNLAVAFKGKQITVSSEMQTTLPGLYACGDITWYPGKVKLIATAIGEAATAVNHLAAFLKKELQRTTERSHT